jgi:nucleotide-binding universal stress UspA family protein
MSAKTIVVGVDASPPSLRAAALAWRIGRATGATCRLIHAVREPLAALAFEQASVAGHRLVERVAIESRRALLARLRRVVPPAVARTLQVWPGRAARVLAERAAYYEATLVVLGRKRHGPLARALGGSTAHYLVRTLELPILIGSSSAIRRILVAVDESATAEPTLHQGRELAGRLDADLRVLHVVEPVRYAYLVPRAPDRKLLQRRSVEAFNRFASRLGIPESERSVRRGSADAEIAAEAARWRADVVVVGSQGKGFVDRVLIGSTTEWLLDHLTTASLLVVPAPRPAHAIPIA